MTQKRILNGDYPRGDATPEGKCIWGNVQVNRELSTVLNQFLVPTLARRAEFEQSEDYIWNAWRERLIRAVCVHKKS